MPEAAVGELAEELDEHPPVSATPPWKRMLLSRLEPAPIFPAARATASGTMSAMNASTAGVSGAAVAAPGPDRDRRADVAEELGASRISMCAVQLSAAGLQRACWLQPAATSLGAPSPTGIGTYCPVRPSVDRDPRGPDGDERGPSLAVARTRSCAARLPTARRSTSHVHDVAEVRLAHELRGAPENVALGGGLHRHDRDGQPRAAVERAVVAHQATPSSKRPDCRPRPPTSPNSSSRSDAGPRHRTILANGGSESPIRAAYDPEPWPSSTTSGWRSPTSSARGASTSRSSASSGIATSRSRTRAASKLLQVPEPVGMTACYLTRDEFVLELLHYDRDGNDPPRDRSFTEPGLTHVSFSVDDIPATCQLVTEHGGEVLTDTDLGGMAIMVRDPDGQMLELLPMSYRTA